nr:uncharacterized protein LOC112287393 [Physcomitrium patens]|eukprot:XP_024386099.1 uncharacterized protein LOC112287393 [Physcomitrella patens]
MVQGSESKNEGSEQQQSWSTEVDVTRGIPSGVPSRILSERLPFNCVWLWFRVELQPPHLETMLVLMLASDCSHCTLQQFTVGENSAFNPRSDRPTQIMTLSGLVFLLSCLRH